jgi:hypothetical protein
MGVFLNACILTFQHYKIQSTSGCTKTLFSTNFFRNFKGVMTRERKNTTK